MSDRDLDLESRANAQGPTLIVRLSAMIRIARIHDVSNQAFTRQLQEFMDVLLEAMANESEIKLIAAADYLYLNGVRIRVSASLLAVHNTLLAEFTRRSIGGIQFHRGVRMDELARFFHLFMSADDPAHPEHLFEVVTRADLEHVELVGAWEVDIDDEAQAIGEPLQRIGGSRRTGGRGTGDGEGDGEGDGTGEGGDGPSQERGRAKQVFSRAVTGTRRILLNAIKTGRPDLRFAKRLVQPVVDSITNEEYSIVGLTALKSHDEYTYAHCVNVSTLSVCMGHVMGIPRQALADLGVVALIHDIGKVMVPGNVLRKPAKLTDDEWRLMRRHPLEGVKMMMSMPGLSALTLDSMRICLEHHMCANLSGYPKAAESWEQACMSRIVALADCFDAMTAHRAYRKRPFTQYEALRRLVGPDRDQFDPAVRWALIKTVGVYPAGSILATDSGHVVLALSPNPHDARRPNCKVVRRPDGSSVPANRPENWDPMPPDVRVVRVLKPEDVAIDVDEQLSAFA